MVLVSGVLRFVRDEKSTVAAESLAEMVESTAEVERDGDGGNETPIDEIVGDVIHLSSGDIVPADLRIFAAHDLFVSQASLTGESEPIEKRASLDVTGLEGLDVAVGLTPEMLPMLVTTCLGKGAVDLSHSRVIVKRFDSIQDLGVVDVLCTDKTGTLTEDRIVLERHLDVNGREDARVLRYAFLNSYFSTGVKNLVDNAIIERALAEGTDEVDAVTKGAPVTAEELAEYYHGIDELPLDFERRRLSVVVGDARGRTRMVTKGALEEVLGICSRAEVDGQVLPLTDELAEKVISRGADLADEGMRVLGVARKDNPAGTGILTVDDERDMVLIGYLAFLDPPKESSAAVKALLEHGVETKVLTGDSAVDVAREAADIILLEKDLMVLERGIECGRRTYANMIKYVKMTVSSNFGNIASVLVAAALLPFLPMTAVQLLLLNLIYDLTCTAIPWDNVDEDAIRSPRRWDTASVRRFMVAFGPLSSIFGILTFAVLFFFVCPAVAGGAWGALDATGQALFVGTFQAGWFVESMWTQTLVVHLIRTEKTPFVGSCASLPLVMLGSMGIAVATLLPASALGAALDFCSLPVVFWGVLAAMVLGYAAIVSCMKKVYLSRNDSLL